MHERKTATKMYIEYIHFNVLVQRSTTFQQLQAKTEISEVSSGRMNLPITVLLLILRIYEILIRITAHFNSL